MQIKSEDPAFELAEIERNRLLLLTKLRGGSEFTSNKRKMGIKTQNDFEEQNNSSTLALIEEMHHACMLDYQAIKEDVQAMNRFAMIKSVTEMLKKKHI